MFHQDAWPTLGHYVYALFDPNRKNLPFYVGKGVGNRVFAHAQGQMVRLESDDVMSAKQEIIAAILKSGEEVVHKIVRYGMSHEEAIKVEASLIDMVNHIEPEALTNEVSGHGVAEGIRDARDLKTALHAEKLDNFEEIPLLIIKIERKWGELLEKYNDSAASIERSDIFDAVKGNWVLSIKRASQAACVLAVARGIVRGVFVPSGWEESNNKKRKKMAGELDAARYKPFVGKSVAHLYTNGSQNPIKYICC
ncbi:hypothetical protein NHH88_18370 [Oxalobacteraceae bacterium OTU3CAMAD1]|nr:hypothetical protein NHH88_18370 [Oxalobacteraceae bacterium OTU3CAMAD1]